MLNQTIGFIGAGQMARALAQGFIESQLVSSKQLIAADAFPAATEAFCELIPGASTAISNADLVELSLIHI